jgi:predicted nucleic-acid-binding Zn-ribbon protein
MKSGKCPRCGSAEIYHSKDFLDPNDPQTNIYYIQIEIGSRETALVRIVYYVCGQCNHMETYVADDSSMQNILREWKPLNPPKTNNEE